MTVDAPKRSPLTRRDEAHFVVYRRLSIRGLSHDEAYALATQIVEDLTTAGLTVTKRRG